MTSSPTTTSPTPTPNCDPLCSWSQWFDVSYPQYGKDGGDYETYENISNAGFEVCNKEWRPENISCRAQRFPDTPLDQLGQVVSCDVSTGLICHNKDQTGFMPVCYNYEISVYCCRPLPPHCYSTTFTTTTPTTTTETTSPTSTKTTSPTTTTETTSPTTTTTTETTPTSSPTTTTETTSPTTTTETTTTSPTTTTETTTTSPTTTTQTTSTSSPTTTSATPTYSVNIETQSPKTGAPGGLDNTTTPGTPPTNKTTPTAPTTVTETTTARTTTSPTTTQTTTTSETTTIYIPTESTSSTTETTTTTTTTTTPTPTTTRETTTIYTPTESTSSTTETTTATTTTPTPTTTRETTTIYTPTESTTSSTTETTTTTTTPTPTTTTSETTTIYTPIESTTSSTAETTTTTPTPTTTTSETTTIYTPTESTTSSTTETTTTTTTTPTPTTTRETTTIYTPTESTSSSTETTTTPTTTTTTSETTTIYTPTESTTSSTTETTTTTTTTTTTPTPTTTTSETTTIYTPTESTASSTTESTTTTTTTPTPTTTTTTTTTTTIYTPTEFPTSTTIGTTTTTPTTTSETTTVYTPTESTTSSTTQTTTTTTTPTPTTTTIYTPTEFPTSTTTGTTTSTPTTTSETTTGYTPTESTISSTTETTITTTTPTPTTTTTIYTPTEFPTSTTTGTTTTTTPTPTTTSETTTGYTPTESTTSSTTETTTTTTTTTTETPITSTTECVCVHNGTPYPPGQTITTGVANGTWCYEVFCSRECNVHVHHWYCASPTTTRPTTTTTIETPTIESTTTRETTTPQNTPTSEITTPTESTPTPGKTTSGSTPTPEATTSITTSTPSTPTTTKPTTTSTTTKSTTKTTTTTTTMSTTKKPGCPFDPYREHNETWILCNCTMARCLENNTVEIIELKCEPPPIITCANGQAPIRVLDDDLCCWHWECDCVCSGWGDPHYRTFDGTYYSFQGNCTYTLVEEIEKKIDNFGVYIDNYDCGALDRVSCPRDIIVRHETQLIRIKAKSLAPLSLQVIVNDEIVGTPFKKYGVKVYTSGINYVVEIPELEANITYNGLAFSVKLPFRLFGRNTQGQCGTCTNDQTDDCRLPNGTIISNCEIMADSWIVPDPRKPECGHFRPTIPPKVTPSPCKPSPLCDLLLEAPFKECHKILSPDDFHLACTYDSCHVPNSNIECTSLQQYALLCGDQGVCVEWRSRAPECPITCPSHKVYNACGPVLSKTCETLPEEVSLIENNKRLVEGCFCPQGTMPFSPAVDVCVQSCGCVGPDNVPRKFGEQFLFDCQDCVCREGGSGITCEKHECKALKQVACDLEGYYPEIQPSSTDSCCNETVCTCDTQLCSTKSPNCAIGYEMIGSIPDGHCCPVYTCVRKNVCVHGNAEYLPGAPVLSDNCQSCVCTQKDNSSTELEIKCTHVPCNVQCPTGYGLKQSSKDCCGVCEQTHCLLNLNGAVIPMENGQTMQAENDNCTIYSCTVIRKQFITSVSQIQCPLFDESQCEEGTILLLPNGCCKICIKKTSSCQLEPSYDYIFHNNCRSENRVRTSHCDGTCGTYSLYSAEARAMSHRCTCCQEVETSQKRVKLQCPDGSEVDHDYIDVEKCDCISTNCGLGNANENQTPVRAKRSLPRKSQSLR